MNFYFYCIYKGLCSKGPAKERRSNLQERERERLSIWKERCPRETLGVNERFYAVRNLHFMLLNDALFVM